MKRSAYYTESLFDASLPSGEQPSTHSSPRFPRWLHSLWENVTHHLFSPSDELQVWYTRDSLGQIWWSAYDPETQRSIVNVPETEVRIWVENRYSFSSEP